MNAVLKAGCLLIYILTVLTWFIGMPTEIAMTLRIVSLVLLVTHALELLTLMRFVRLYPGALAVSIVLTLLFGLLHWKPLADAARAESTPM
jgi:hypothetical protein